MSSLITLRLPIVDNSCLLKALENCGFTYEIQQQPFQIILNNTQITFGKTNLGIIAKFEQLQRNEVNRIYKEYERIYTEKIKKIQDQKNALHYLVEQAREKLQKLQNLKSQLNQSSNSKEITLIKDELSDVEMKRKEAENKAKKMQEEQLRLEKERSEVRENMVNNIFEKAKKQGFKIKKIQHKNKTQLVLVRQIR
ncbi:hypothetical protein LCGC14_1188420 [marine sediment metagenome]|uniref:Uncharacterized protein n=1 Tax=marine sediment metagenome TaxID=412755 RepID=A0A0F9PQI5_9ZZZZ